MITYENLPELLNELDLNKDEDKELAEMYCLHAITNGDIGGDSDLKTMLHIMLGHMLIAYKCYVK